MDDEEPEVNLKDPWLAAVLAFLVPGLGHLYQRRFFKAAVYSVCIIGLWAAGMQISGWRINQAPVKGPNVPRSKTFSFLAQAGVGLPAIYAWYQAKRYDRGAGKLVRSLPDDEELVANFTGLLYEHQGIDDSEEEVTGTISIATTQGDLGQLTLSGRFRGVDASGQPVDLELGEGTELGPVLMASKDRFVYAPVVEGSGKETTHLGTLQGTMPRGFWDWFQAPLDEEEEQNLHRELGKMHELALVFTWIAGLLNLLAIWDALEGPAYGYGLVEEEPDDEDAVASAAEVPTTEPSASEQPRKAG